MIVSSDSVRGQHLVQVCGLPLAGGMYVSTPTAFCDSSVQLVTVFSSGLVLLLARLPCSGLPVTVPWMFSVMLLSEVFLAHSDT